MNTTIDFCIFKLVWVLNFILNKQFRIFERHIPKKAIYNQNYRKSTSHWILHVWINLGTKFQLKLTILIFWTKFFQKGYFWSKKKKSGHHHWFPHFWISLQPFTKYLRQTLICMWNSKIRGSFNFYFSWVFC